MCGSTAALRLGWSPRGGPPSDSTWSLRGGYSGEGRMSRPPGLAIQVCSAAAHGPPPVFSNGQPGTRRRQRPSYSLFSSTVTSASRILRTRRSRRCSPDGSCTVVERRPPVLRIVLAPARCVTASAARAWTTASQVRTKSVRRGQNPACLHNAPGPLDAHRVSLWAPGTTLS